MRTFFERQDIQERIKGILQENACGFIVEDYWGEVLDFLRDDETVFSDIPDFLTSVYAVEGEDLQNIFSQLFELLNQYKNELGDFFRIKTMEEIETEEQEQEEVLRQAQDDNEEEVESEKSIKSNAGTEEVESQKSIKSKVGTTFKTSEEEQRKIASFPRNDIKKHTAQFYFSPEDEEEIKGIIEHGTWNKDQMDKVYNRVAEDVMKKTKME